jgi:hypothetical protein
MDGLNNWFLGVLLVVSRLVDIWATRWVQNAGEGTGFWLILLLVCLEVAAFMAYALCVVVALLRIRKWMTR